MNRCRQGWGAGSALLRPADYAHRIAEQASSPVGPRLALIILSWNDRPAVLACLESIRGQIAASDRIVVVDNASADGSAAAIMDRFPEVHLIQNVANLGFAGGNNRGIRWALDQRYPWIMLLNSDTEVPTGTLDQLLTHGEKHPKLAAIQPLLVEQENPDRIDSMGHGLSFLPGVRDLGMGELSATAPNEATEIFGACAAAVLLRAEALRLSGLFDEGLFVLLEDVELMFRLRLAGFEAQLLPHLRVLHKRGVSKQRSGAMAERRRFYLQRNIVALALRYWPQSALLCAAPLLAYRKRLARQLAVRLEESDCRKLWQRFRAEQRTTRRRMRVLGMDRWFG